MKKLINIYKKNEEIINYLIIGFSTTLISLIVYYLCVYTIFNPKNPILLQCANIISWIVSVTFAYFTNRSIVFKSKNKNKFKESVKFYASRIVTLLIDMLFMYITVSIFLLNDKIMKILANIIVIILNYLISKFLVFVKNE